MNRGSCDNRVRGEIEEMTINEEDRSRIFKKESAEKTKAQLKYRAATTSPSVELRLYLTRGPSSASLYSSVKQARATQMPAMDTKAR